MNSDGAASPTFVRQLPTDATAAVVPPAPHPVDESAGTAGGAAALAVEGI